MCSSKSTDYSISIIAVLTLAMSNYQQDSESYFHWELTRNIHWSLPMGRLRIKAPSFGVPVFIDFFVQFKLPRLDNIVPRLM